VVCAQGVVGAEFEDNAWFLGDRPVESVGLRTSVCRTPSLKSTCLAPCRPSFSASTIDGDCSQSPVNMADWPRSFGGLSEKGCTLYSVARVCQD